MNIKLRNGMRIALEEIFQQILMETIMRKVNNLRRICNKQQFQKNVQSLSTVEENEQRPQRIRRRPTWRSNYEVSENDQSEDPFTYFGLFSDCDPIDFEAVKELKW